VATRPRPDGAVLHQYRLDPPGRPGRPAGPARLPDLRGGTGHPGRGGRAAVRVRVAPSYGATYDDLDAAFRALRAGAELVATQVNRIAARDDGEHLDTGGWVRLLEYATGSSARVLGKPSPEFFTAPLDALGRGAQSALVVGDDLAADIGGGHAVGAATVLVRSGKGDRPQPGAQAEPDAVIDSVADLPGLLRG
jgi:ribonucleotide monophosphatase NagD (HAD superfamily)